MFKKLMAKKSAGFTLVEILVVILIIGLLFVFLVPKISSATDKARETGIKTDFHSYEVAFESVMKEHSGLGENAVTDETTLIGYINEYLDPALAIAADKSCAKVDPWNNKYTFYSVIGADTNDGVVAVYSLGKDSTSDTTVLTAVPADGDAFDTAVKGSVEASTVAGHDYTLACAYISGVEYTATAGFSTNIAAK